MSQRFFSSARIGGDRCVLEGSEAHHLARVMRAKPGTEVVLFDGSGAEFRAKIESVRRDRCELQVLDRIEIDRELPRRLTIAAALPKGDRQRWMVEKLVELGVACFVPLQTRRGVARAGNHANERLRRAVIEASKQCGRNRLMEISSPRPLEPFLQHDCSGEVRWLAHPRAMLPDHMPAATNGSAFDTVDNLGERLARQSTATIVLAIGPEGGFDPQELRLARAAGWRPLDLGPRVLRTETAAVTLAAIAAAWIDRTSSQGREQAVAGPS